MVLRKLGVQPPLYTAHQSRKRRLLVNIEIKWMDCSYETLIPFRRLFNDAVFTVEVN